MRFSVLIARYLLTSAGALLVAGHCFALEEATDLAAGDSYYAEGALGIEPAQPAEQPSPSDLVIPPNPIQAPYGCGDYGCGDCCQSPWVFNFSQTAGYGTNLALPITLTPANTLIAPAGLPGAAGLPSLPLLGSLGVLDNLGLIPGPIPDVPSVPVFKDDFQFQTDLGLQNTQQLSNGAQWTNGYALYQTLHPSVDQLDLGSHTYKTAYSQQISDRMVATADYYYSYYFLSGSSYVSQNQIGGALLYRANDLWDYQVRVFYLDANFRPAPFLNSGTTIGKLEGIRYLRGNHNNYLNGGYSYGVSDAATRAFTYQVNGIYIGGRWLYGDCLRNEFKITFTYGSYDFYGNDPIDNVLRQDNIYILQTYLGRKMNDNWTLFGTYVYYNSVSNVVRQDYDSSLVSIGLAYLR